MTPFCPSPNVTVGISNLAPEMMLDPLVGRPGVHFLLGLVLALDLCVDKRTLSLGLLFERNSSQSGLIAHTRSNDSWCLAYFHSAASEGFAVGGFGVSFEGIPERGALSVGT